MLHHGIESQIVLLTHNMTLSIHSVSETLPSGQLSNVPWRRSGVKYTNNEAYFDCIEEVDCIIDKQVSLGHHKIL